jgi:hypothetical protein
MNQPRKDGAPGQHLTTIGLYEVGIEFDPRRARMVTRLADLAKLTGN